MHSTSALWKQISAEMNHQKEVKATINGTEYGQKRIISAEISGRLFDTPGVGNAFSRTLKLVVVPHTGPNGNIPPLSEIRLYVRLVSADGLTVSEYIPKGVFYADTVQKDSDTGAVTISAFDAIMRLEAQFGVPKEGGGTEPSRTFTVSFDDGFKNIQKFQVASGGAMPTPTTPTHDGEQFFSWYPDPADTPTVTRDMRFVAKWAQKYTVIFEDGSDTPQVFTCSAGDATPTPTTPEKSGFDFDGWLPTPTETVTGDATYTAQWAGVTSVAIVAYPTKTDYFVGETLDYTGLSVVLTYANGTTEDVTADCTLLPAEGTTVSEPGDIMVDVRYNGKSLGTFWAAVASVAVTTPPDKVDYTQGDTLDLTGLVITETLPDGTTRDITPECTFTPPEGSTLDDPGTVTVTVERDGVTVTTIDLEVAGEGVVVTVVGELIVRVVDGGMYWTLYDTGLLDIYGNMSNYYYSNYNGAPWYSRRDDIKKVTIGDSTTSITHHAFYECSSLASVTIGTRVTSIGNNAFLLCRNLTSITIPDSVTGIGSSAFYNSGLTSITIPDSVTRISDRAFSLCERLASATLSRRMTEISERTFNACRKLVSVSIPVGIISIADGAFDGCTNLVDVYYSGTESQRAAMTIGTNNDPLLNATWHYNSTGPA